MIRKCLVCDKEFLVSSSKHKYCSSECNKKDYVNTGRQKITKRAWYEKNKTKINKHKKELRAEKRKKRKVVFRACAICGKNFPVYNSRHKFCSKSCRGKDYAKNHKEQLSTQRKLYRLENKGLFKARYELNKEKRHSKNPKKIYTTLSSRKKNAPFKMTFKEFSNWYNSKSKTCFYCGIPEEVLNFVDYIPEMFRCRLQIERVDNEKRYELDNIELACRVCNTIHQKPFSSNETREIAKQYITPKWKNIVKKRRV